MDLETIIRPIEAEQPWGKKMRVIVTGATGFIGKALCKELLNQGNEVFAVIRPQSPKKNQLEVENELLHILEIPMETICDLWERYHVKADVFYHLAWNGSSGADRDQFEIQQKNVGFVASAIYAAKACGCKKIIGAGSQAEYGIVRRKAKEGKTVPHPFMMYGAAKLASYYMGTVLAKQLGITLIWPRIYSVYGVGENQGTLIDYVLEQVLKGNRPELSSCDNMWNFLEISDCVKMLILLAESDDAEGIYHIASKDTRVLREYVEELRDLAAPKIELGFGYRKTDRKRTFWMEPDITKLLQIIGKDYEFVSFRDGVMKLKEEMEKKKDFMFG